MIALIGRLVPQKGISFFLDTLKEMLDHQPSTIDHRLSSFKVLIVGEGPERKVLELRVASSEFKGKVIFAGFRKDVSDILGITDILVLPSTREGLPMILLEAMAAGAIVVATRVGGTPELIEDGESGFLFEAGDAQGLKQKLGYVLGELEEGRGKKDEGRRVRSAGQKSINEIRENAKETVAERFSLEKMVEEHERAYEGVLKSEEGRWDATEISPVKSAGRN